jgi:spore germination cell wall hydrolase CwlJ-like protein
MYFESNRSSRDGLMAVGTVVMNRVASPLCPNTICGVRRWR